MGIRDFLSTHAVSRYETLKNTPRQLIFNRHLILTCMLYATAALPLTWDQGSAAVITSLPSFQQHFGISSGSNPKAVKNFVSLVYVGQGVGAAASFLFNDRIGRLWSLRLYSLIWIIGQMIAVAAPNLAALYASRIVSGLGLGALTVTGPISLVEVAPAEFRGLLTAWFTVTMGMAHFISTFTGYGLYIHVAVIRLQYQVVWFAPCLYVTLCMAASFFLHESPRWLFAVDRHEEAITTLVKLRGLEETHPRVQHEILEIQSAIHQERELYAGGSHKEAIASILKETFTARGNVRRVQQAFIMFALPQLSGSNSISSYFVSILKIVGVGGTSTAKDMFLTGMYTMCKFYFAIISSFFFIDLLGRRRSLFVGITCQFLTDIYLAVYIKIQQQHPVSESASEAALAAIFIHAFGYSVGLLTLPYVFGGELWPNRIRSFGAALSQSFHWLFSFAMAYALPSLLDSTDDWGAFIFFAAWCAVAFAYVFLTIPEIAGLSVEEIDSLFEGPIFAAYAANKKPLMNDHLDGLPADENCVKIPEVEKAMT